jgi:hypothetical protein
MSNSAFVFGAKLETCANLNFLDGVDPSVERGRDPGVHRLAAAQTVHLGAERGDAGVLAQVVDDQAVNA